MQIACPDSGNCWRTAVELELSAPPMDLFHINQVPSHTDRDPTATARPAQDKITQYRAPARIDIFRIDNTFP